MFRRCLVSQILLNLLGSSWEGNSQRVLLRHHITDVLVAWSLVLRSKILQLSGEVWWVHFILIVRRRVTPGWAATYIEDLPLIEPRDVALLVGEHQRMQDLGHSHLIIFLSIIWRSFDSEPIRRTHERYLWRYVLFLHQCLNLHAITGPTNEVVYTDGLVSINCQSIAVIRLCELSL